MSNTPASPRSPPRSATASSATKRSSILPPAYTLLMLALSLALPGAVRAQDASYGYGGLAIGQARGHFDIERISARQLLASPQPLTVTGSSSDLRDTAYRLFLGYQFDRHIGLEAGFFNLGRYSFQSRTEPDGVLNGLIKVQGASLDLVGTLPISDDFAMLARVGAQYPKTRISYSGGGAVSAVSASPSQRQLNYKFGLGLQYRLSANLLLRAEAEQYRVADAMEGHGRISLVSLSLVMPFGEGARGARAAAPSTSNYAYRPPVVEPTPAPPPVVSAPPPMPMPMPMMPMNKPDPAAQREPPRRVSFSAESLFGFDQSSVSPKGREALDQFARDMAGTRFELVVVEGHTDRLGSAAYNQTLSLQRADAVKAYLVASGGLDASKISTAGRGEGSPVTRAGDCLASLPTAALRACLQPDRRVDVEVSGTR
ncbi:OmpA family protein [Paucibacter sp. APW11]|uniref:OmpA family protein n=1 Tax=Roseateles aquae TaxID=3077235 RepID=A0ABU3P5A5_9BURK|nr:OmpA family protein [Paucibacter sp. APW11]MDT8997758.1 OmpA family protein [Paucibacter sp. APW11]